MHEVLREDESLHAEVRIAGRVRQKLIRGEGECRSEEKPETKEEM